MDLKGRTVIVTGCTSGIGRACAEDFAKRGSNLILVARRNQILDAISSELKEKYSVEIRSEQLDVSDRKKVDLFFSNLPEKWKNIDILVNNAGGALGKDKFHEASEDDWDEMINTNVRGLLYMSKRAVSLMLERNMDRYIKGHIINIGSIAGTQAYEGGSVYCGSKSAVRFISDGMRIDLVDKGIKVTNIQPGLVETNFSVVRFHGDTETAEKVYKGYKPLQAEDISELVIYSASAPDHVQICELTVTPSAQASGTVVHKSC